MNLFIIEIVHKVHRNNREKVTSMRKIRSQSYITALHRMPRNNSCEVATEIYRVAVTNVSLFVIMYSVVYIAAVLSFPTTPVIVRHH